MLPAAGATGAGAGAGAGAAGAGAGAGAAAGAGLLALPRRNAESGCNHLLFQALLHTVFR